jgi:hypothetical protein
VSIRVPADLLLLDSRDAFRLLSLANRGLRDLRRDAAVIDDELLALIDDLRITATPHAEAVTSALGSNGLPENDDFDRTHVDMTVKEAADLIGCSERHIRREAQGMFLGRKNRGRWLVDRGAVTEYAARRKSA